MGGDILGRPSEVQTFGGVCLNTCRKWTIDSDGHYYIPYTFDSSFSQNAKNLIRWAMNYIEGGTDIRFIDRTGERNYLRILKTNQCSSYVGMYGGGQIVNLADPGCIFPGTILHELTHALGVDHEHQRPDRDDSLTVQFENAIPSAIDQLTIMPGIDAGSVTGYDYGSIMHYDRMAFSSNGQVVLDPKNKAYNTMLDTTRAFYSPCDWHEIFSMYPKSEGNSVACKRNIAGRGLEPASKCLSKFSETECGWACTIDSQEFWAFGYCQVIGGGSIPPPPWELTYPPSGADADSDGSIQKALEEMKKAAGAHELVLSTSIACILSWLLLR